MQIPLARLVFVRCRCEHARVDFLFPVCVFCFKPQTSVSLTLIESADVQVRLLGVPQLVELFKVELE